MSMHHEINASRVIWVIFKGLEKAHNILIDLKKDLPVPIIPFKLTSSLGIDQKANYY